jgi:hypothetical protein
MKHIILTIAAVGFCYNVPAKQNNSNSLQNIVNTVTGAIGNGSGTGVVNNLLNNAGKPLSNDQIIQGLREALKVGTNNSTAKMEEDI